jgi:hypothetical protein
MENVPDIDAERDTTHPADDLEQHFTDPVPTRHGLIQAGWYLKVDTTSGDAWLLVERREECTQSDCHVAHGNSWACVVTTLRGRGVVHLDAFDPATARIPAEQWAAVAW